MRVRPGGAIYCQKNNTSANSSNHSTVAAYVHKGGKLYLLICGHSADDAQSGFFYEDVAADTSPIGIVRETLGTGGEDDMALVEIMRPAAITADNFAIDGDPTEALKGTAIPTTGNGKELYFSGSRTRVCTDKKGVQRVKVTAAQHGGSKRFRIGDAEGKANDAGGFECRKGDSGAPVYEKGGKLVGMYHMGDGGEGGKAGSAGVVIRADHIFDTLGVELASWENRDDWLPKAESASSSLASSTDSVGDGPPVWSGVNTGWTAPAEHK